MAKKRKSNNEALIAEYLSQLNSDGTRKIYQFELHLFFRLMLDKAITSLTAKDISAYSKHIQEYSLKDGTVKKTSSSTRARKLSIVSSFLKFLFRRKYIKTDLSAEINMPKVNQKSPEALTEEEATALLRVPDKRTSRGLRDYLMLKVFLLTGCRLQELININWGDFSRKHNFLTLTLRGKGNKERIAKLPKDLEDEIKAYKGQTEHDSNDPLFLTTSKRGIKPGRISAISIRNMLSKYSKKALISKKVTPHSLRHTCFSLEVAHGADAFKIMEQAGHTSLNVTQRYVRLFNSLEDNGVDYNPLSKKDDVI